ncbi:thioredoxin-like protein [Gautieria morchelliformis]|nr:thioredoxin-like protein [Gautieria morchelliformis]
MGSSSSKRFTSSTHMAVKDIVEDTIANNKVVVFSKSWCPYCKAAKATLRRFVKEDTDIKILELDQRDDGSAIQTYLAEKSGQSTVPNVFINTQHVGGQYHHTTSLGSPHVTLRQ